MELMLRMLPQERLAEKIVCLSPWRGTCISLGEIEQMMCDCDLKYRRGKSAKDLRVMLGKGSHNNTRIAVERTAEEIDKVMTIRW